LQFRLVDLARKLVILELIITGGIANAAKHDRTEAALQMPPSRQRRHYKCRQADRGGIANSA